MRGWGSIAIGDSTTIGEEDYVGAARSIRSMVDILGPVAALCRHLGPVAPSRIVGPYNRMRDELWGVATILLGEAREFVRSQSLFYGFESNWARLRSRLAPDIVTVFTLPRIEEQWQPDGPAGPPPSRWTEAVGPEEPFRAVMERAYNAVVAAGLAGRLPTVRAGYQWIFLARYGGAAALGHGKIGALPTPPGGLTPGTLIWLVFFPSPDLADATTEVVASLERTVGGPDITPAVDRVDAARRRFEHSVMPAIYQPVRAATKAAEAARDRGEPLFAAMREADPDVEPGFPSAWDGTFGFPPVRPGAPATDSASWAGPLLVGGAVLLLMLMLMGGD